MKKGKKILCAVLSLGILAGGGYGVYRHFFAGVEDSTERVSSTSEDAVYVDQVSVITGYGSGNGLVERYGGEVEPQATLEVKLENERKVDECFVKEGEEVKEGQRLFSYDTQEDEDKLAQAEIEIERSKSEIELSEQSIAQYEKDQANASADDKLTYTNYILQEKTSIKQKEYDIKSKELEIEQLKANIEDSVVTAEMAGIVQKINDSTDTDSYAYYSGSSESSAYITILAAGDFRIKGTINEQNLNMGLIYEGMEMIVHSRVDDSIYWTGTITEINTDNKEEQEESYYYMESSGSSNYSFYVELDSSERLILGQHVYMEENVGQEDKKDGLWLEEYYIMQEEDKAYVWAADTKNLIEKREVTLGEYDEDQMKYEITEGLDAEDYIAYPTGLIDVGVPVIYNDYSSLSGTEDIYNLDEDYSGDEFYDMDEDYSDEEVYDLDEDYSDDELYDMDMDYSDEEVYDLDEDYSDAEIYDAENEF